MVKNFTVWITGSGTISSLIDVEADSEDEAKDNARKILEKDIEDAMFGVGFTEESIEVEEVAI